MQQQKLTDLKRKLPDLVDPAKKDFACRFHHCQCYNMNIDSNKNKNKSSFCNEQRLDQEIKYFLYTKHRVSEKKMKNKRRLIHHSCVSD